MSHLLNPHAHDLIDCLTTIKSARFPLTVSMQLMLATVVIVEYCIVVHVACCSALEKPWQCEDVVCVTRMFAKELAGRP